MTRSTVDGKPLELHGAEVTLSIEEGAVAGKAPINRFHGSVDASGSSISFGPMAVTRMAGPPDLMAAEHAFLTALERVTSRDEGGQALVLTGPGVELAFQRPRVEDPMAGWLGEHPAWSVVDGALTTERSFEDFAAAWTFATRVALAAERSFHHPEVTVSWGRVVVSLRTHDTDGSITDKDRSLATAIDEIQVSGR